MSKRHKSAVELLPDDVVEVILSSLPVKSLLKFKTVSKNWKSTIESKSFKQRQLNRRSLSRGPDVLFMKLLTDFPVDGDHAHKFVFGSSVAYTVKLPTSASTICYGSCDGLVCLYNVSAPSTPNIVLNPATRWHQSFPLSILQQFLVDLCKKKQSPMVTLPELGFGKDKISGTYKPVLLYNSSRLSQDNSLTTCEVFYFGTNSWRYLFPASPHQILAFQKPVYFDGSLYWLTECEETKVLALDLHTETFQVITTAPCSHAPNPRSVTLCVLDNRLCVSQKNWPTQVIWSLHSSSGKWKQMWCIDLTNTVSWFGGKPDFVLAPVAILNKNKLLLQGRDSYDPVVIHDRDTNSCDLLFVPINAVGSVCYFESLLSLL